MSLLRWLCVQSRPVLRPSLSKTGNLGGDFTICSCWLMLGAICLLQAACHILCSGHGRRELLLWTRLERLLKVIKYLPYSWPLPWPSTIPHHTHNFLSIFGLVC